MQFSEAIKAIKEKISLVDLARRYCDLKPNGSRFVAPCPFHQETKPSFYIFADEGSFYCFGCQAAGDIFEFYARINGVDFKDSVHQLAEEAGITIDAYSRQGHHSKLKTERTDRQEMLAMHDAACAHFRASLGRSEGAACRDYISRRGLSEQIIERFGLGWAPAEWHSLEKFLGRQGYKLNLACECGLLGRSSTGLYDRFHGRLMFPIKNLSNQVIAFGGRIIADADEAKYINSSDTPIYGKKEHLYGLSQARRGISAKGHALLTEGYMDVLALHQFGFDNSVAALGTALTEEQVKRLSGFTARFGLLFDGDPPGRKAALRATSMLLCAGLECSVILLPDGEDIDSLLRDAGPATFEELRRNAPDGLNFCIQTIKGFAPREAIEWVKDFINKIKVPELTSHFLTIFSQQLGISENIFREGINPKKEKIREADSDFQRLCERDTQIMVFLVRYPEKIEALREIGADMALTTNRAKTFWNLIEKYGAEEVVHYLDEKQKSFWQKQRGPLAAPRVNCEMELNLLAESLDKFYAKSQLASLQAALGSTPGDFEADLKFLHAIRDTMRENNEQS